MKWKLGLCIGIWMILPVAVSHARDRLIEPNKPLKPLVQKKDALVYCLPASWANYSNWDGGYRTSGVTLICVDRITGDMHLLASTGLRSAPTRRIRYYDSRLVGVKVKGDLLYMCVWQASSYDRPPLAAMKMEKVTNPPAQTTV